MNGQEFYETIVVSLESPWTLLLVKATAVLACGWIGHWALRRSRPRFRLLWWRGTVCALLLVGALAAVGPRVRLPWLPAGQRPAPDATGATAVTKSSGAESIARPAANVGAPSSLPAATAPRHAAAIQHVPLRPKRISPAPGRAVPATGSGATKRPPRARRTEIAAANVDGPWTSTSNGSAASAVNVAVDGWPLPVWLLVVWLSGVGVCLAKLMWASIRLRRFLAAAKAVGEPIGGVCREMSFKLNCRSAVDVLRHDGIASPVLYGACRPKILLPAWMCEESSRDDWRGVFAHELSHVRSRDLMWQTLMHVVSVVLWFHPFAWRLRRTHVLMCELNADHDSAVCLGETRSYMRTLARVALASGRRTPNVGFAMARTSEITRRLDFLKRAMFRLPPRRRFAATVGLCGLFVTALLGSLQFAAAEAEPAGDVELPEAKSAAKAKKKAAASAGKAAKQRSLLVRVRDVSGKPIPNASIVVRQQNDRKTYRADSAGNFTTQIPQPPPSLVVVTVSAPQHVRMQARFWNDRGQMPEPIPATLSFRMERGTTVGGRVVDMAGEPIAGAKVYFSASGRPATPRDPTRQSVYEVLSTTGKDGRWRCDVAPAKMTRASLRVTHSQFVSERSSRRVPEKQWGKLRKREHVSLLERGHLVEGVVRGPDGKPIAGAKLALGNSPFGAVGRHPKPVTGADGVYRFENVKAGDTAVTVVAKGFAPELKQIEVSEELDSVDFQLKKGKTLRIRVVDQRGKPIRGARVVPDTWRGHRSLLGLYKGVLPHKTDEQGRVVWNSAPEDKILVDVYQKNYMSARNRPLVPRKAEYVVELPPALLISGRVIDAKTKKPIPTFKVDHGILFPSSTTPSWPSYEMVDGRGGKFRVEYTHPYDRHLVRVRAKGYLPAVSRRIKSDEGRLTFDFELQKGEEVEGTVLTADGKPIAGARVYLATASNGLYIRNGATVDRGRGKQTTTDKSGKFRFEPQTEQYSLFVAADVGYRIVPGEDFERTPRIRVEPWAAVKGKLMIGAKPGARRKVGLYFNNRTPRDLPRMYFDYDATTDRNGRFSFDKVPVHLGPVSVARQVIIARFGNSTRVGSSHGQRFELVPGKTTTVTLGGTGRPVVGQLQLPAGTKEKADWNAGFNSIRKVVPAVPAVPGVPRPFTPTYSLRISADGRFRVEDLPPGEYQLVAEAQDRDTANRDRFNRGKPLGGLIYRFKVAPIPGGRSDEPLNLGVLELKKN